MIKKQLIRLGNLMEEEVELDVKETAEFMLEIN